MSHPTTEELHDMAYGFAPADPHIVECRECDATVRAVAREKTFLREALRAPAPSRSSRWIPLAAAAALVAALGVSLLPARRIETPRALLAPQEKPFGLEDLVREASSSDELRARIAKKALRSHGGIAVDALRKAGKDGLAEEIERGGDDPELRKRLRTTKLTLSFTDAPLSEVAGFLSEFLALTVIIESGLNRLVDVNLADVTAEEALESLAEEAGVAYVLVDGTIRFQKHAPGAAGFVPVRPPASDETRRAVASAIGSLDDDSLDVRDAAARTLAEAGFAAETALWKALDSKNDTVRASCASALEKLYERRAGLSFDPPAVLAKLQGAKLTLIKTDAPFPAILEEIARQAQVPIFPDAGLDWSDERTSLQVKDITAENTLKLLVGVKGFAFAPVGNSVFVSRPDRLPVRTRPRPQSTLWLEEEHATLVALLDSADAAKLSRLSITDVAAIRWAQSRVDAQTAGQLESAVQEILAKSDRWAPDERAPIAKLSNRIKLDLQKAPAADVLKSLSKEAGVEIRLAKDAALPTVFSIQAESISIGEALDLMTLPYGCEAVEAGGAVEIRRR